MQAMVAACFSRLRYLNPETSEGFTTLDLSSSVLLSEQDADTTQGGLRMTAPDPRSGQIPAAGTEQEKEPPTLSSEILDDGVVERLEQEAEKISPTGSSLRLSLVNQKLTP